MQSICTLVSIKHEALYCKPNKNVASTCECLHKVKEITKHEFQANEAGINFPKNP